MAVTNYYSFGGEILGEETGGVRRDYLTDALGSVTATVTEAGAVENTYRYKPYGETLAKSGLGSDPKFLWNGASGYYGRNNGYSLIYIRERYYLNLIGRWSTKDDLWPDESDYNYAWNNPCTLIDNDGNFPQNKKKPKPIKNRPGMPPGSTRRRVTCYGDSWLWIDEPDLGGNQRTLHPPMIPGLIPIGENTPMPPRLTFPKKPIEQLISECMHIPIPIRIVGGGKINGKNCGGANKLRDPQDGDCAVKAGGGKYPIGTKLEIIDCETGKIIKTCSVCDTGKMHKGSELDIYVPGWDFECTKNGGFKKPEYCVRKIEKTKKIRNL